MRQCGAWLDLPTGAYAQVSLVWGRSSSGGLWLPWRRKRWGERQGRKQPLGMPSERTWPGGRWEVMQCGLSLKHPQFSPSRPIEPGAGHRRLHRQGVQASNARTTWTGQGLQEVARDSLESRNPLEHEGCGAREVGMPRPVIYRRRTPSAMHQRIHTQTPRMGGGAVAINRSRSVNST